MSVVDSSALVAVLLGEPGWQQIQARLEALQPWHISVVTLVEASMVIESRLGAAGKVLLDSLLRQIGRHGDSHRCARWMATVRARASSRSPERRRLLRLRAGDRARGTAAVRR
jgi:uncharacterized protein with PIN domain